MDPLEPSAPVVIGGIVLLVVAFAAREVISGALHAAGHDLWEWVKRHAAW